jgi:hypothetical protein
MTWLRQLWQRISGIRLALVESENRLLIETNAALEEENYRLRGEVRALTNSLLSGAGVTPLPPVNEEPPKPIQRIRHLTVHQERRLNELKAARIAVSEAKELRKRFEEKYHPAVRSN